MAGDKNDRFLNYLITEGLEDKITDSNFMHDKLQEWFA